MLPEIAKATGKGQHQPMTPEMFGTFITMKLRELHLDEAKDVMRLFNNILNDFLPTGTVTNNLKNNQQ